MKPFLKWVGGKSQILDEVLEKFPNKINNYHEIFTGGGSVLIGLLQKIKNNEIVCGDIVAYDINEVLINLYVHIQQRLPEFFECMTNLVNGYNASEDKSAFYYTIRTEYNEITDKSSIMKTSKFLFLNKTCFRGLYREGSRGFNVSYGNYKNPAIFDREYLTQISELIKNVKFRVSSFRDSLNQNFLENDFIYMDPPYVPENSKSFVAYTVGGFDEQSHNDLFNMCKKLKCKFLMSNSNTTLITDAFSDCTIETIDCKRRINSKNPEAITQEVLVSN